MFVCVALILAVPDIGKVISGEDTDAVGTLLTTAFGPLGARLILAVVMISFVSCLFSLQAAASRLLFAFARDKMICGSDTLQKLSRHTRIPYVALIVCGIVPAVMTLVGLVGAEALSLIVSFAAIGIYLAFQMIVLGALIARMRGWRPSGQFTLGGWGPIVTVLALVYGVAAVLNMAWPRMPDAPWYLNYAMVVMTIGVVVSGLFYLWLFKPHEGSLAPSGDAVRTSASA
jgi:amino acid transporter